MTSPPPPGPMPAADTLALEQRLIAEAAIADMVAETTGWLSSGGFRSSNVSDEEWQVNRLAELGALRRRLSKRAGEAKSAQQESLRGAIEEAAQRASGLGRVPAGTQEVVDDLTQSLSRIWDEYPGLLIRAGQDIVTESIAQVRAGNLTRVDATTRAVDRLIQKGIVPVRDKAGRQWTASAYTEMRMRTAALDAGRGGREEAAREHGTPYVQVADAIRECKLCRPWEGKILTLDGVDPDGIAAGSIADARSAGLAHPNCRHHWAAYFPGLSLKAEPEEDAEGYEFSQKQRALERKVRRAKLGLQAATELDPNGVMARNAKARLAREQAKLRALVKESGQRRRYDRESVKLTR